MRETVNVTRVIAVPSEVVWAAISGIDGIDRWFPVVASCRVEGQDVGALRVMELEGGGRMVDRVEEINHGERRFRYDRIESPFPVSRYLGTVLVGQAGQDKCEVSWTVEIEVEPDAAADLKEFLRTALSDGVSGIERDLR